VTFLDFLAEFTEDGSVGAWKFNPAGEGNAKVGQKAQVENRGGETHTFTPVAKFGGGFVGLLNAGQAPVEECARIATDGSLVPALGALTTSIPPGGKLEGEPLKDDQRYQCCIHPWMRLTIKVEKGDNSGGAKQK